ncbi:hypothetical protein JD844_022840 [Phrynosoma platyrhinos]|uniref:Cytoplasmic dynein 1 intermediate chain 2 n=1 Tax=Phrynosoma platyrhinos TaxID=52577 RepID=A0ABQ7SVU4_PHRPL|nr:hypothetical protein JD844_022840 [Phrynosoma platyrhinos]
MSDKSELKAELERKKQRLAQIREEKKRKEEERKKKETDQKKESLPVQDESDLEKKRREAEALLQSMGLTPDAPMVPPPMSPSSKSVSTPSEAGSQDSGDGAVGSRRGPIKLAMSKITQVDFPPREMVTYTKETQTPVMTQSKEDEDDEDDVVVQKPPVEPEEEKTLKKEEEEEVAPHELTEEEKQQILHSEEFLSFFDHSTRIVERALSEQINIFFDYSGRDLEDKEGEIQAGAKLSLNRQFFDERWSKHRVVSCLDWSSQYPELLVASYNNNEDAPHEPDGVALVWNMKYKKTTPEYVFHCQSAVMSATFAKFHPNLVVGGTYSGQIVLWDNRSNKRTPVQRTPLSAAAHTHPVYCVNVVGTQNAHNLISISTDGKICSWSLDMLSQPQNNKPLYSFEDNSDYVYDVMWSPTHPALFACVDGMGRLDLWNLNNDTEVPTASITVEGNPALNRVRWTNSGREIAVGDSEGQIVIYDVGEQIAVPRSDEWTRFGRTLAEINANRADAEEEAATRIPS